MEVGVGMTRALLVIDVQNGFVNEHTRPILPTLATLIGAFVRREEPLAFTRFVNRSGSPYERWIGWTRFREAPENALADSLDTHGAPVFSKHVYSAFTVEMEEWLSRHHIDCLVLCGIATDGCVLKTAVDAFERSIEPQVVTDACASHAGREVHEAGLLLLARFIGKGQLKRTADFV